MHGMKKVSGGGNASSKPLIIATILFVVGSILATIMKWYCYDGELPLFISYTLFMILGAWIFAIIVFLFGFPKKKNDHAKT